MGHNDTACRLIRNNNYCAGWLLLRKSCYSFCNNTTLLFMIWLLCTMTIICGWGQTSLSFTWGWLSSKIRLTVTRWMVIISSQCWLWGCQCECWRYLSHHYWDGLKSCEFRYRWIFIISKFWTNNPRGDSSYNEDYNTQDTITLKQQLLLCHEIYCIIIASYYGWCVMITEYQLTIGRATIAPWVKSSWSSGDSENELAVARKKKMTIVSTTTTVVATIDSTAATEFSMISYNYWKVHTWTQRW